jgi:hypothetical protein
LVREKEKQSQSDCQIQQQQQQEGHVVAAEEMTLDLLFHCWNLAQDQVKRAVDFNREAGLKNPESYVGYGFASGTAEPMDVKQKRRGWAQCTHKKTGNLITLDSLVSAGRISDFEKELFAGAMGKYQDGEKKFHIIIPKKYINQIRDLEDEHIRVEIDNEI